jgi:hypothetical protein
MAAAVAAALSSTPPIGSAAAQTLTNHKGLQFFDGQLQYYSSSVQAQLISRAKSMGIGWVRLLYSQNQLDSFCTSRPNVSSMDATVNALRAAGIQTLALIGQTNKCDSTNGVGGWVPPKSPSAWVAHFVTPVIYHLAAQGIHNYEIWNEANGAWDWPPAVNAAAYTTLLCNAYVRAHSIDGQANVIGGALSGTSGSSVLDTTFLSAMYAAGARGCFDAIADHPYPANGPTNNTLRGGSHNWERMYLTSPSLAGIMASHGDSNKQIWVTEIGCSNDAEFGGRTVMSCSQTQLAQMVTDAFNRPANGFAQLGPIIWFEFADYPASMYGCRANSADACYGLFTSNWSPKPAPVSAMTLANGLW